MIQEGQTSFRSQVSYVNLVAVLIISAMLIVVWSSKSGALAFGLVGVVWTGLILRSGINVSGEGFTVRGLFNTTRLAWADTDSFIVLGYGGTGRAVLRSPVDYMATNPATGPQVVGLTLDAIEGEASVATAPMFSVVAAVTRDGRRLRVHGTASTPLDPEFATQAAAELNRQLRQRNPNAAIR